MGVVCAVDVGQGGGWVGGAGCVCGRLCLMCGRLSCSVCVEACITHPAPALLHLTLLLSVCRVSFCWGGTAVDQ